MSKRWVGGWGEGEVQREDKKGVGGWPPRGLSIEGGFKLSAHYGSVKANAIAQYFHKSFLERKMKHFSYCLEKLFNKKGSTSTLPSPRAFMLAETFCLVKNFVSNNFNQEILFTCNY